MPHATHATFLHECFWKSLNSIEEVTCFVPIGSSCVYNDGLLDERLLCFKKQAKIEIENVEVLHSVGVPQLQ